MTRDEAKAKVAKLMAMGNDNRGNEHEGEAALRQAAWLMRQHDIEQAEIELNTGRAQAFEWSTVSVPLDPSRYSKQCTSWIGRMALSVARFTSTIADYSEVATYGMCIRIRGEAVDVAYAVHLVKHLRDTIRASSARYPGTRKQREDFRAGMVSRLAERMRELTAANKAQAQTEAAADKTAATALVTTNRKASEMAIQFGKQKIRSGGSRRYGSTDARDAGVSAGNNVGFGRPVSGPASQAALSV